MSATLTMPPGSLSSTTVADVLAPIHRRWRAAVQASVQPALLGTSTIWDRWAAARYLEEWVAPLLEQELSLVRLTRIGSRDREQIEADYSRLEQVRVGIEAAARRHHTGGLIMTLLQEFLGLLSGWWTRLEHATATIPVPSLSAEAVRMLTDLGTGLPRAVEQA
jgi:hypothetical protein